MSNLQITCITKSVPNGWHEHITDVGNPADRWNFTVEQVIVSIDSKTHSFYVRDANTGKVAYVGVVRPEGRRPYIRTYADGLWNDNLLSLTACPWRSAA